MVDNPSSKRAIIHSQNTSVGEHKKSSPLKYKKIWVVLHRNPIIAHLSEFSRKFDLSFKTSFFGGLFYFILHCPILTLGDSAL